MGTLGAFKSWPHTHKKVCSLIELSQMNTHTHMCTHTHRHTLSLSLTLLHTHIHRHSLSLTLTHTYTDSLSLTLSLTLLHAHTLTHTHTHTNTLSHTPTHPGIDDLTTIPCGVSGSIKDHDVVVSRRAVLQRHLFLGLHLQGGGGTCERQTHGRSGHGQCQTSLVCNARRPRP